jgi:hypothetical protein
MTNEDGARLGRPGSSFSRRLWMKWRTVLEVANPAFGQTA